MHLVKIILVAASIGVVFIALVIYSLAPTVRDVSNEPSLRPFIGKHLEIKSKGYIITAEEGQFVFNKNILSSQIDYPGNKLMELEPGDQIIIREFRTHRSALGSGFTHLYALGATVKDHSVTFEYSLGTVDPELYSQPPTILPITIWQDENDNKIELKLPAATR